MQIFYELYSSYFCSHVYTNAKEHDLRYRTKGNFAKATLFNV